jgi:hypothetical protein
VSRIADELRQAAEHVTTWPSGQKIDNKPSKTMTMRGERLGSAAPGVPNVSTPLGSVVEVIVIAPADDPNHEPPNIWEQTPTWLLGQRL